MEAYGDIFGMFEPVFQWIKKNYPSGGFFIVEADRAKFYGGNPDVSIYSNEITSRNCDNQK